MTSRAVVQTGRRRLEIDELECPRAVSPDGGLLEVEACGMCGSDADQYEGYYVDIGLTEYPVIPGHEMVGRLAEVGPELARRWNVRVGDRVAVEAAVSCQLCEFCRSGQGMLCPRKPFMYGFRSTAIGSGLWGGYSQYMSLGPGTVLHRMSDDLSPQDAVLYNPFAGGFEWASKLAGTRPGDRVLILGCGMRGLGCVIAAKESGAEQIIVTGLAHDAHKLRLAERFGATATLVAGEVDVPAAVAELTRGRLANRVVDTTPRADQPVLDSVDAATPGGTVVWAGLKGSDARSGLSIDKIVMKGITVVGAFGVNSWAYEQAVRVVNEQRYAFDDLHTHTLPLEGVERAMQLLGAEQPGEDLIHITIVPTLTPSADQSGETPR